MYNSSFFNEPLYNRDAPFTTPHVAMDGRYLQATPSINRILVIGKDSAGNPVYGTLQQDTEIDSVGSQMDFFYDPSIPTTAQAGYVAAALADRFRLQQASGFILAAPHCGLELYDVVVVSDALCAQQAQQYRVTGIRYEYNPKRRRFLQRLSLGGT